MPVKDLGAWGGVCASIVTQNELRAISRRQCFSNVARPHADRFLHAHDFSEHVADVKQATFGGIWLVEMLVEIVGQVD